MMFYLFIHIHFVCFFDNARSTRYKTSTCLGKLNFNFIFAASVRPALRYDIPSLNYCLISDHSLIFHDTITCNHSYLQPQATLCYYYIACFISQLNSLLVLPNQSNSRPPRTSSKVLFPIPHRSPIPSQIENLNHSYHLWQETTYDYHTTFLFVYQPPSSDHFQNSKTKTIKKKQSRNRYKAM